jgi:ketosteroid isomerase-like protein
MMWLNFSASARNRVTGESMKIFFMLMFIITSCSNMTYAAGNDATAEIERLEGELAEAIVKRDVQAVERIEVETYVHTDAEANVSTRDDFVRSYREKSTDIKSIRFDDLRVQVYDNAAVVRGIATVGIVRDSAPVTRKARYTRFYVRFKDGWRAVAGHSSPMK